MAELFDTIQKIRTLAAALYDKFDAQKTPPHEIQKQMAPFNQMLEDCVCAAPPRELMRAVKQFESIEEGHMRTIKFMQSKLVDTQLHRRRVETRITEIMSQRKADHLEDGDFRATLLGLEDGGAVLTVR